jgi:predicted ATPase
MNPELSLFRVDNLHGHRTIQLRIRDDRLVLVGENGTGKSTVASLLYHFLTCQWSRLRDYSFDRITACIRGETIGISKELIESIPHRIPEWNHGTRTASGTHYSDRIIDRIVAEYDADDLRFNLSLQDRLSSEYQIPFNILRNALLHRIYEDFPLSGELGEITERIRTLVRGQVLYLPTYRRIEQDLHSIYPGLETDIRRLRRSLSKRNRDRSYIEIVEFGMRDVEQTINKRMARIKESLRTGLSSLAGTYLSDIIQGVDQNVTVSDLREITSETISSIFARIDEATLPDADKRRLSGMLMRVREHNRIGDRDKVTAHYLMRLIDLHMKQQHDERDVHDFVALCNNYLVGKAMVYDNVNYEISIRPSDNAHVSDISLITLDMLSSGEKQIISLFTHIYLSRSAFFFIIIDEPELSLSVPWQNRFLPDLLSTRRCGGLVAVTHSPFIYDNELDIHTHSINEFVLDS